MTILVTGASGLVGMRLCQRLIHDEVSVRGAVRSHGSKATICDQVVVGLIDEATDWHLALLNVASVVHCAARVHVMHDTSSDPFTAFRAVNVEGTLNLARQAAAAGVRRFVFISSVKVNGESTQPGALFTETDSPNPQDAYGQSKHEAEQGLRQIALDTGMEVVIIRPPLVYGPGV